MQQDFVEKAFKSFSNEKFINASKSFTEAIEAFEDNHIQWANRAIAYMKKDKFDEAEEDCTKALEKNAEYDKAYCIRGIARDNQEKKEEALEDFIKYLENHPDDEAVKERVSTLKVEVEEIQKARAIKEEEERKKKEKEEEAKRQKEALEKQKLEEERKKIEEENKIKEEALMKQKLEERIKFDEERSNKEEEFKKREEALLKREERIGKKEAKINIWEDQQKINIELQNQRDDEFKKRVAAENLLLEEKQKSIQKELDAEKKRVLAEYAKLEEEKLELEAERLRVYDSGISSRSETAEREHESVHRIRRRRPRSEETNTRRRNPEVGRAPAPDFENVTSKVETYGNRNYKSQRER